MLNISIFLEKKNLKKCYLLIWWFSLSDTAIRNVWNYQYPQYKPRLSTNSPGTYITFRTENGNLYLMLLIRYHLGESILVNISQVYIALISACHTFITVSSNQYKIKFYHLWYLLPLEIRFTYEWFVNVHISYSLQNNVRV